MTSFLAQLAQRDICPADKYMYSFTKNIKYLMLNRAEYKMHPGQHETFMCLLNMHVKYASNLVKTDQVIY